MKALQGLLRKEAFHILRDRRTLIVILLLPVVQVLLFGYAIRTDVDNVRLAIVDPAPDAMTLRLRSRLAAAKVFRTVAVLRTTGALESLFQKGTAQAAIIIEPRFAERLGRGLPARLMVITDATEPNTGSTIQSYAERVIQEYQREVRAARGALQIVVQARLRFNPTAESKNLFVPGLMAFVLTIISSLMTAITITREKEAGTMETLLVSPLRPWQIIAGKVVPYLAIGFASVIGIVIEARLIFGVPMRGSLSLLLAEGLLYILVSLSLGVLISARTSSQRVAMTAALLGTMLPTMMLSGFIFPVDSMPRRAAVGLEHRAGEVVRRDRPRDPAERSRPAPSGSETLILLAMAAGLLTLSTRSFSERLE